jgi:hypothetical protein
MEKSAKQRARALKKVRSDKRPVNLDTFVEHTAWGWPLIISGAPGAVGSLLLTGMAATGNVSPLFLLSLPALAALLAAQYLPWRRAMSRRPVVTKEVADAVNGLRDLVGILEDMESREAKELATDVLDVAEGLVSVGTALSASDDEAAVARQHEDVRALVKDFGLAARALAKAESTRQRSVRANQDLGQSAEALAAFRAASARALSDSEAVRDLEAAVLEEVIAAGRVGSASMPAETSGLSVQSPGAPSPLRLTS